MDLHNTKKHQRKALLISLAALMFFSAACNKTVSSVSSELDQSDNSSTNTTESAGKNEVSITMAVSFGTLIDSFQQAIDDFNSADNGYHLEVKYFLENKDENGNRITYTHDELKLVDFQVIQEVINTDDIDIVGGVSFENISSYRNLMKKGAFLDLYEFMKEDDEVNPELMNKHILELNEIDGKLYGIPRSYTAKTMIGKTEYVGNKPNWSVDEFLEYWDRMPDNATISRSRDAETVYYDLLRPNLSAFVDYENVNVNFDSSDFRKLLEFCKRFESTHGEKGDYDYIAPNFVDDYTVNGFSSSIVNTFDYVLYEQSNSHIKDGEYTLVGFPSSNGEGAYISCGGCMSICRTSSKEKQEAAWAFIRQFYTEEYQQEHVIEKSEEYINGEKVIGYSPEFGFCINNAARQKTAEKICGGEYWNGTYESKGQTYETVLPDMADCEFIERYIDSIDRLDYDLDIDLWDIVQEEVLAYLGGDQDIDRTIDMIQNRGTIMVSEKS